MSRLREKTTATLLIAIFMISAMVLVIPTMAKKDDCVRIKDGILTYSAGHFLVGQPLKVGYDIFGYNYQAHLYNGYYCNVYLGRDGFPPYEGDTDAYLEENPTAANHWTWPYRDVQLLMKWNDAWLSNRDCDGDEKLDRHYGHTSYIGSGAWETNHMWGTYPDGTHWNYFVKIVAVPLGATTTDGIWYTSDGTKIGPDIWGQFAEIMWVENDPTLDLHGVQYISPESAGFGHYK